MVIDWLKVRKTKKATNTKTAFNGFVKEIKKSKLDKNEILKTCIERSWSGFKNSWLESDKKQNQENKNRNAGELLKEKYGL